MTIICPKCHTEFVILPESNEPISWDELKGMTGKPVWLETNGTKAHLSSGWGLVGCTSFTTWEGVEVFSIAKIGVTYSLPISEYGKTWNAYRKER